MTACSAFCVLTLCFIIPRDLFVPETRDVEVWLGFEATGWLARISAPAHWGVFAVGAWGFWKCRPWVWPWAAVYVFYVALSHLIWNEVSPNGRGWPAGLAQAAGISLFGWLLLRVRPPETCGPPNQTRGDRA